MIRRVATVVLLGTLLLGSALAGGRILAQETAGVPEGHPLAGSWLIVFPEEPGAAASLYTFDDGGTVVGSSVGGGRHGTWKATGDQTAAFTVLGLIEEEGLLTGLLQIEGTAEIDPATGTLTVDYTVEVISPEGAVLVTGGPFTALGTRITIPAPAGTPTAGTPAAAGTPMADGGLVEPETPVPTTPTAATPAAEAAVTVETHSFFFAPDQFSIPAGSQLTVTNPSDVEHSFTVDELGINVEVHPGETKTVTINADPGQYSFHCEYHPDRMRGTMTVV